MDKAFSTAVDPQANAALAAQLAANHKGNLAVLGETVKDGVTHILGGVTHMMPTTGKNGEGAAIFALI